jgi:hypothetical protein
MSQRQIAQVAAKAAEAKAQRLKEEANEATFRADEFDAKCRAAIQSAASSYDKFMHASRCESDLQKTNASMESKLDEMRNEVARREDIARDEETAKQRLESARGVRARSARISIKSLSHVFTRMSLKTLKTHVFHSFVAQENYSNTNARTQALSKAKTELESWREQHSRSETAERELRKRTWLFQSNHFSYFHENVT